jgi:hypothetical protein
MRWRLAGFGTFGRAGQGRGRERSHSRPRVARAVAIASDIHAETGGGLGSARAGAGIMLTSAGLSAPAFAWGMVPGDAAAPTPALLWAAPRDPRAEALAAWLAGETAERAAVRRPTGREEARRRRVWSDIDETMGALRAS